ncbi:MAG: DinB family protein [Acidimicrobiia bacterium]
MDDRTPFLQGGLEWIYGEDPPERCPTCEFAWDLDFDDTLRVIRDAPGQIAGQLDGRDGMVPQPDGSWNATAYVWHLADLARAWAERWIQIAEEPGSELVGFDPDDLADARNYRRLPTAPGLWSLRESVQMLLDATARLSESAEFVHGEWGQGTVRDAMRWLAHEFHHHERDIGARAV